MPQMAPISWLTLFILFSLTFLIFHALNYFCFFKKFNQKSKKMNLFINNKNMNWKW